MSDTHPGPGWWQASDLRWYPPESHPDHFSSLPAPPTGYVASLPARPTGHALATTTQSYNSVGSAQQEPRWAPRLQVKHMLIIAVCVAYVLSPVDLAPELVLGPLGLPDDIVAVLVAFVVALTGFRGKEQPDL